LSAPLAEASVKAVLDFADVDRDFAARLDKATRNASSVVAKNLDGVTKSAEGTTRRVNAAFDGINTGKLTRNLGSVDGAAKNTAARLGDLAGTAAGKTVTGFTKLGDSILGTVGKFAKFAGGAGIVTSAVSGLAGGFGALTLGFGRLQSIEQAEAKLTGLGHSADGVTAIMDSALASVKGTAFGLGEAAGVAASAVAAGVKPGEDLTRTLKLMADAAVIGGTSMGDMGAIFNKVATSGKVQGEVLAQLGDRGIPIIQLLADEMGVAASEVADLGSEGKISFDTFRNAIEKGMGGAAQSAGQTFSGAMDNAKAALGRLGAEILEGPFNAAPTIIGRVTEGIDLLTNKVKGVSELLQTGDYTADIGKALGVSEDSAVVDRILRIRDAIIETKGQAQLFIAAFTGGDTISDLPYADSITKAGELARDWGDQIGRIFGDLGTIIADLAGPVSDIIASLGEASGAVGISTWSVLLDVLELLVPIVGEMLVGALQVLADLMTNNQWLVTALVAAYTAYRTALIVSTAVQWALNAAMSANPIALIVIGIAALVAALVLFFTKTETGRKIWTAAWNGIKAAAATVWSFLQTVWDAILVGLRAVGDAAVWLWQTVFVPVWEGIKSAASVAWAILQVIFTALKVAFALIATSALLMWEMGIKPAWEYASNLIEWAWNSIIRPVFDALKTGLQAVGEFFGWVWDTLIKPAWDALVAGLQAAYDNIIKPLWDNFIAGLRAIGDFFVWVWDTLIKPAWDALATGLTFVYDTILKPLWDNFIAGLRAIGDFFVWIWDNVIKPAWDALGNGIKWVLDNVITPVFDGIKTGLGFVRTAFDEAVKFIGQVWDTIRGIVAKPAAFVIDAVYNRGIREAWNKVAGWLNLPELAEYKPDWLAAYMATGGQVAGPAGRDRVPAMLTDGEWVHKTAAVDYYGPGVMDAMNNMRVPRELFLAAGGPVKLDAPPWTGGGGESNLKPAAILARRNIHLYWPEIDTIGGYRASDPYPDHPSGLALDVMTGDPVGTEVNDWLHREMNALALGYTIWKQIFKPAGGAGNLMEDRGSPTQNHMDHVHALFNNNGVPGIGEGGAGGGGIVGRVVQFLRNRVGDAFDAIMNPIGAAIPTFGDSDVGRLPKTIFDTMRSSVRDFLTGKADEQDRRTGGGSFGPGAPGGGAEQWRDLATQALMHTGFIPPEQYIENMLKQIQSESSGNERAIQQVIDVNSGGNEAGGLLQVTPGTFAAYRDPTLPNDRFDPFANMVAALNYVRARYGDPNAVWGQGHGYDEGGLARGKGVMLKNVIPPERVLSPGLTVVFERFVDILERFANGDLPAEETPPAPTEPSPTIGGGTGAKVYEPGIAGANAWAADQDFGTQAKNWGADAAKEIIGQFTDPFGLSSLSDRAIDDLRTAAEALEAAQRQQQGANVTVNVNGTDNPNAVGAAVVDQIEERMSPVTTRYRNGG